jgi:hypothetical protein
VSLLHSVIIGSTLSALAVAPFQCPSKPDPTHVREDTPGEALYDLATQFGKSGDRDGRVRTLQYLVERYPRSRFAFRARDDLKELGVAVPDSTISPDPEREAVPFGRLPSDSASASMPSSAPPAMSAPAKAASPASSAAP